MKTQQVSSDLSAYLVDMSKIAHDDSLTSADRAEKLDAMKTAALKKIEAESDLVSFAAKSILDNIKDLVQSEDWAKLPPPRELTQQLNAARALTAELNSIRSKVLPNLSALQTAFIDSMLMLLENLSDSDVLALDQQWKAADIQFQNSNDAAQAEWKSGIATGAAGIITAVASIVAKGTVTGLSKKKFDEAKPDEEMMTKLKDATELKQQDQLEFNTIRGQMSEANKKAEQVQAKIKQLKATADDTNLPVAERQKAQNELNTVESDFAELQKEYPGLQSRLKGAKEDFELSSNDLAAVRSEMDAKTSMANQYVQELRASNDIVDYSSGLGRAICDLIAKSFDLKSKGYQLDSEKASFMNNFAGSAQQNARKSANQAQETINTIDSSLAAIMQGAESTASYMIKTA
jgi:hypothetical protein